VNPINPLTSFFVSFLLLIALSLSMTHELSAQFAGGQGKGDDRQTDGVALATLGSFTLAELTSTTDETTARFAVVGSENGWESFVRRGVCIGTGIVPGVLDTCFDADTSGTDSFEVLVEDLAPSTDYTARAFAISSLEITYSASVSFTTPQPPAVTTQGVTLVESRSAVVTGAVTDEGSGAVVQQGVCYGQNENLTTADTCVQAASLEASFEVELTGLLPGTVYFVRAFAQNSEATGYGNQLVFSTLPEQGAMTDIDGQVYSTVIIGEQEWMAENLNAGRYAGGGTIPEVTGAIGWTQLDSPAWSWYGNENANGETYGKLYNGFAVAGAGNLCPDGWLVPTDSDWQVLERVQAIFEDELGNTGLRGVSQASGGRLKATGTSLWSSPNSGASNTSGWSALPGGFREFSGTSTAQGTRAGFWTSSASSDGSMWARLLHHDSAGIERLESDMNRGHSIRCMRAAPAPGPAVVITKVPTSVTATSAVLGGTLVSTGSTEVTDRGLCYGTEENPGSGSGATCIADEGTDANYITPITGLTPATLYYARAYAVNQSGTAYGNQVQFTTLPAVIPDSTFILHLTISDTYVNALTLTAGTKPDATYGFDIGSDVLAPPPPPDGVFDARVRYDGQSYFSFYQPPTATSNEWLLEFRPQSEFGPVTISWDSEDLPAMGDIRLVDTVGGSLVNVDMRGQSSLTIEQAALTQLTLRHTNAVEVQASYRNEWDMVGLPVEMEHEEFTELFPAAVLLSLYSYDGIYQQQQVLTPGVGYWLNFSEQSDVTFVGSPVESLELELLNGWNLISGLSSTSVIDDPGDILLEGAFYGFDGIYTVASQMNPGKGYWAGTLESGTVSVVPAGGMSALAGGDVSGLGMEVDGVRGGGTGTISSQHPREDESMLAGAHSIQFTQHERSLPVLVWNAALSDAYHPLQLSLPPRPPQGSVDARLPEGRWIIEENIAQIQLQQNEDPLAFVIEGDAAQYEVIYHKQGQPLRSTMVEAGATETVPQDADALMVYPVGESDEELGATLPSEFALEQNYPNPFNPSTTIRYALPEVSDVQLEVYNITGQRIATLVNATQPAGTYEVNFDASILSSGVYLYRLTAGSFTQTRQMMLMK